MQEDTNFKEEPERWEYKNIDQFLIEVAGATEQDIEYNVIVDTSDIIPCESSQEDCARAIVSALSEATALHWM
jgi:hypothetical protein